MFYSALNKPNRLILISQELTESNAAEIAKLKTFFEYSLSLKDESLSAAEAGLESVTVRAKEESEKREEEQNL